MAKSAAWSWIPALSGAESLTVCTALLATWPADSASSLAVSAASEMSGKSVLTDCNALSAASVGASALTDLTASSAFAPRLLSWVESATD